MVASVAETQRTRCGFGLTLPWLVRSGLQLAWCLYLVGWTVSLLTTYPAQVADNVLPPDVRFPVSKALHVTMYAVLAGLIPWLWRGRAGRWVLPILLSLHG